MALQAGALQERRGSLPAVPAGSAHSARSSTGSPPDSTSRAVRCACLAAAAAGDCRDGLLCMLGGSLGNSWAQIACRGCMGRARCSKRAPMAALHAACLVEEQLGGMLAAGTAAHRHFCATARKHVRKKIQNKT